jgi:hypothetical protein
MSQMNGYVLKYALTSGIRLARVRRSSSSDPNFVVEDKRFPDGIWRIGKEWVPTREEAEMVAKEMAKRKIASLERQLVKLRQLAENPKWAE